MSIAPSHEPGHATQVALGLLVALVCLGSMPLFLRYLARFPILDAWTVNAVRYGMVAGIWLPFVIQRMRRFPVERKIWKAARGAAVTNMAGQMCWAISAYHNEAGVIAFVIRSSFLFATVYSFILLPSERATVRRPRFWLGAAGVVGGLVLLFGDALRSGKSSLFGLTILLAAAACWGLYWVLVKRDLAGYDQRTCFAVNSVYTAAGLLLAMFLFGNWRALADVPLRLWGVLAISAFTGLLFSHVLLYRAIQYVGPVVTSGATCVQPFVTAFGAWLLLGEVLLPSQWVGGCALVGSSLILLSLRLKARGPVVPPVAVSTEPLPEDAA